MAPPPTLGDVVVGSVVGGAINNAMYGGSVSCATLSPILILLSVHVDLLDPQGYRSYQNSAPPNAMTTVVPSPHSKSPIPERILRLLYLGPCGTRPAARPNFCHLFLLLFFQILSAWRKADRFLSKSALNFKFNAFETFRSLIEPQIAPISGDDASVWGAHAPLTEASSEQSAAHVVIRDMSSATCHKAFKCTLRISRARGFSPWTDSADKGQIFVKNVFV